MPASVHSADWQRPLANRVAWVANLVAIQYETLLIAHEPEGILL